MGAKDWMLLYADTDAAAVLRSRPEPDRDATHALVDRLHPATTLTPLSEQSLEAKANPPDGEFYAGVFPGLTVITSGQVALDYPSALPERFIEEGRGRTLYLHAMHSVVDWFAFGVWEDGVLRRALSLSPDDGVLENLGEPLEFERPYWAGERRLEDDGDGDAYPLDFHPLELGEDALRNLFGFNWEGAVQDDDPELGEVMLLGYRLS
ncbi:hypothetical protein AB0E69_04485 [Kribbella sp. NPDC026611]|uniref:DUF6928 family protein n=1 Tax=Kribbella sp. NPDC026611 TaxID=3154911 RepID=UPI0033CF9332